MVVIHAGTSDSLGKEASGEGTVREAPPTKDSSKGVRLHLRKEGELTLPLKTWGSVKPRVYSNRGRVITLEDRRVERTSEKTGSEQGKTEVFKWGGGEELGGSFLSVGQENRKRKGVNVAPAKERLHEDPTKWVKKSFPKEKKGFWVADPT